MNLKVIEKRKIFLSLAAFLVGLSIFSIVFFGLKPGIDLTGGTNWQLSFSEKIGEEKLISHLYAIRSRYDFSVSSLNDGSFLIHLPPLSENEHQALREELSKRINGLQEKSFSSIGSTIGSEIRKRAVWAILLVLLGISLYVAWAFRKVSRPVKSFKYGVITLVTLFHDVVIPTGVLAFLGHLKGVEIDTNFIVALLTIMGFSVHDTIVVFDRIRENLLVYGGKNFSLKEVIDKSVNQTFMRSVSTSLSLFLVLLAIMFFGPSSLFYFALIILVGTFFGTYSSIFVASPLLYLWQKKSS